jgi:carboxyl-terminal processing protease
MSLWEIEARLRGEVGSKVKMRVVRARRTEPTEIELAREQSEHRKVEARVLDSGIGFLSVPDFSSGVASEVETRLKMLKASGMSDGLLVDLRGNATGRLEEASRVADLMLPKGVEIVTVKGRDGSSLTHASMSEPLLSEMPLVLLMDGGTSGPAEVLSAALRDNVAATLVGERTNGRGSEQSQFSVAGGAVLVMTTEVYVSPKGEPIQGETVRQSGLKPDVRAPSQDFVTAFYFENTTEDLEESLNDEFYRKLDEAITKEQFSNALEAIREKILKKAA